MGKPIIGYENLIESASSISVSSEATGFEKELAYNWGTFDGWKASTAGISYYTVDLGAAANVDYWAVAAHTLGTNAGSIQFQYSSDGVSYSNFDVAIAPTDDSPILQYLSTPVAYRYFRFKVTSTPVSFFGVLSFGNAMEVIRAVSTGFVLPRSARMNNIMNMRSEGGSFLGRSVVRKGFKTTINLTLQTVAYGRTTWSDFIDHAELKPFFFNWNLDYSDAVFCWMDGDPTPTAFDRNNTVKMGIPIMGLL